MAGTKAGGKRAAQTNKTKYGSDFYAKIGAIVGRNGNTGGFATRTPCTCDVLDFAYIKSECAGTIGGRISKRTKEEVDE